MVQVKEDRYYRRIERVSEFMIDEALLKVRELCWLWVTIN
jgi:hypothetical protein